MKQTDTPADPVSNAEEDRFRNILEDSVTALSSVRQTLAAMLRDLDDGKDNLRDIVAKQKELQTALIRAQDTEQKYHEWKSKQGGGAGRGTDVFDLSAARYQIGCRLSRIRECCREGAIPR